MKYLKPYPMFEYLMKLEGFKQRPLLGMDVGKTCIGVSVSDPSHQIAQPLRSFNSEYDNLQKEIGELISSHNTSGLVLGWRTYNMKPTENALLVAQFAKTLQQRHDFGDLHFTVWDANYATKSAELLIKKLNYLPGEEKGDLQMLASSCILQGYLDFLNCDKSRLKPWSLKLWSPDLDE
uniref:putative pre-16S rRNA nuclease n=1 Tax=Erigeron canadensis TaxID=72917 RepID=UPI001CB8AFDE|nr:putative pre-16S rRNA nuclease [Erigeron canadensis]XP_043611265.1 putative pre-16S rRNA nuclease [Erigeron canadensis]